LLFYGFSFAIIVASLMKIKPNISKSLKEYADLLCPNGFLRTHQSHLVNPRYVKSWLREDGGILLLLSGEKIPISKPNKHNVKQALQQL